MLFRQRAPIQAEKMMKPFLLLFILIGFLGFSQNDQLSTADSLVSAELYKKANKLRQTDIDSAIFYYRQLETFLAENKYYNQRYRVLLDIGNAYFVKGHADRALETYLQIAEESNLDNNLKFKLYAEISIASIYIDSEEYDKALDQFEKIRAEYKVTDSTSINLLPYCTIYNNEGIAYENVGDYEEAENFYKKAIELSDRISEPYNLANAYSNMGSLKEKTRQLEDALKWHQKALAIRSEKNLQLGVSQSLAHIGSVLFSLDRIPEAEEYLGNSLEMALKMGNSKQVLETTEILKEIYRGQNDYAKAYKMQEREMEARSDILNEERLKNQERLKAKYDYELEKQIAEKNRRFRETVYKFIFGLMFLLFILALILYLLQKSKTRQGELLNENIEKEKHLLHQELEYKNKKLMSNLMFLLQKNELISNLAEKLRELKKLKKPQSDKLISEVILSLKQHLNHESWEEFDVYFQEVHFEFYNKLTSRYQLTPNELKLAAFTKLNLSSKEISSLTGQSTRTIDVGRYRLRKKLGISNSEVNLTTFLNSI